MVCDKKKGGEEDAGEGEKPGGTDPKTRTPHNFVGKKLLDLAIEIVDLPIANGDGFHTDVESRERQVMHRHSPKRRRRMKRKRMRTTRISVSSVWPGCFPGSFYGGFRVI